MRWRCLVLLWMFRWCKYTISSDCIWYATCISETRAMIKRQQSQNGCQTTILRNKQQQNNNKNCDKDDNSDALHSPNTIHFRPSQRLTLWNSGKMRRGKGDGEVLFCCGRSDDVNIPKVEFLYDMRRAFRRHAQWYNASKHQMAAKRPYWGINNNKTTTRSVTRDD